MDVAATQCQLELEQRSIDLEVVLNDLIHFQRRAHDREVTDERRIAELEARIAEEARLRAEAETERQAVIAALSRSARRRIRRSNQLQKDS